MKKTIFLSLIIIIVLSLSLFGCAPKSVKVIVEDREVGSIDLLVFDDTAKSIKYTLSGEEQSQLIQMLDNLGYMDRYIVPNAIASESFEYSLTINVNKKGLKKAYSYYVYIDKTETYTIAGKDITNRKEKYLRIVTDSKKYEGEANQEVINYLTQLKETAISRG